MTTTTATIGYRQTKRGDWVAYGPADRIAAGATVTVTKRDGTTKVERIASIGKTFQVDGIEMVYGYLDRQERQDQQRSRRVERDHEDCLSFGCCGPYCEYGRYPLKCKKHDH